MCGSGWGEVVGARLRAKRPLFAIGCLLLQVNVSDSQILAGARCFTWIIIRASALMIWDGRFAGGHLVSTSPVIRTPLMRP